jgi:hypothetical protein
MKKQTAVEMYASASHELIVQKDNGEITYMEFRNMQRNLLYEAKQMEKEQTIDAVKYGCSDWGSAKDAEQYYNEIYGGQDESK